jgi:hypothetical protein
MRDDLRGRSVLPYQTCSSSAIKFVPQVKIGEHTRHRVVNSQKLGRFVRFVKKSLGRYLHLVPSRGNQLFADGVQNDLCGGMQVEFFHDVRAMCFDRVYAEV